MNILDANLRLFGTLFFTLISSYIVATISFKYVELPSIRLGRYLSGNNKKQEYNIKDKQILKDI